MSQETDISNIEIALVAIWSDLLGTPVDAGVNIFEAGANSVQIQMVLNRVAQLGLQADPGTFFEYPEIASFARACAGAAG